MVEAVKLNQHYHGPPEVYAAPLPETSSPAFDWWQELLLEKEEFDRSRLYFSKDDWDMPSHTINAYYWPYANAVFITSAISKWMTEGADDTELFGRLGFLLGHELGHSIHSNVDVLDDPAARAAGQEHPAPLPPYDRDVTPAATTIPKRPACKFYYSSYYEY